MTKRPMASFLAHNFKAELKQELLHLLRVNYRKFCHPAIEMDSREMNVGMSSYDSP